MPQISKISVFLSHNSIDKSAVEALAYQLNKEKDIEPWLDKWNLIPGDPWQEALENALDASQVCVVFIGPSGIGPWQNEEMRDAINKRVNVHQGKFRVVPVLLPQAIREERGRLPNFLTRCVWVEFNNSLEDDKTYHRLLCGIRGIPPGPEYSSQLVSAENPYRGLSFFDVEHAPYFFGREALTEWLLNELKTVSHTNSSNRFLAIVGASGSGKSSLARAGLLHALKNDGIATSGHWPQIIFFPGDRPLENLAIALAIIGIIEHSPGSIEEFVNRAQNNERYLHISIRLYVNQQKHPENHRVILLTDQFEEVFTSCKDERHRISFLKNLVYASTIANGHILLILTMRSDFYGKCAEYEFLSALISDHNLLVGPMNEEEIRYAIERPALQSHCSFEAGLIDALVTNAMEPGALPLLQDTLNTLWLQRDNNVLKYSSYTEIGGLWGALNQRADVLYDALNTKERIICKQLFLRLTQPGEGTEDTKRRIRLKEIQTIAEEKEISKKLIAKLSAPEQRLITTSSDVQESDTTFIEVAHEALIKNWKKLRTWIEEDRVALRTHRRLTEASDEWDKKGRDKSYLFSGARLAELEEWVANALMQMNELEQAFFNACVSARENQIAREEKIRQLELAAAKQQAQVEKHRAEEEAKLRQQAVKNEKQAVKNERRAIKNEKRAKRYGGIAVVFSLLIIGFGIITRWQQKEANRLSSNYLFSEAQKAFESDDPRLTLRLGQEALRYNSNNLEVDSFIYDKLVDYLALTLKGVSKYSFNSDSKYLSFFTDIKQNTGTLIILNLESNTIKYLPKSYYNRERFSYFYSPDGKYISFFTDVKQNTGTLKVLNLESGITEKFLNSEIFSYLYSPNSKYLSFFTDIKQNTGTLKVLNLESGITEKFPNVELFTDSYSPDSKYLSFFMDVKQNTEIGILKILNLESRIPKDLPNSDSFSYRYSPDSKYLSFFTDIKQNTGTLNILNLESKTTKYLPNSYYNSERFSYFYSPNDKYLSFFTDVKQNTGTLNILNLESEITEKFPNNNNFSHSYSPDSKYLSFFTDVKQNTEIGTLNILNLESGIPEKFPNSEILTDSYSPDSKYLSFFTDVKQNTEIGTLNILNLESGIPEKFPNSYINNYNYEYSPDSKYLSFFTDVKQNISTLKILNLESGVTKDFPNSYDCRYSLDSMHIAINMRTNNLKIIDLNHHEEFRLIQHQQEIVSFEFSNDGKFIYTYSNYSGSETKGTLKVTNLEIPQDQLLDYYNKLYAPLSEEERQQHGLQ